MTDLVLDSSNDWLGKFQLVFDAEFEESKHPRAENGEFGSGGGGGSSSDPFDDVGALNSKEPAPGFTKVEKIPFSRDTKAAEVISAANKTDPDGKYMSGDLKPQLVSKDDIVSMQPFTDKSAVAKYAAQYKSGGEVKAPLGIRYKGKVYVANGTHRVEGALSQGATVPIRVVDVPDGRANDSMALDRDPSQRTYDVDGHLHVAQTNVSKANVCDYLGSEILQANPELQGKVDPDQIYKLLRHPDELARGAASLHGKPLLFIHKGVDSKNHPSQDVVGAVSNPKWSPPYLKADLAVWLGEAIKAIEDESKKELSAGYRYKADMTPGTYEGESYSGVMRDIIFNHIAMVEDGRAGPDVVVGDSALNQMFVKEQQMATNRLSRAATAARGALVAYLAPRLAADAKIDLTKLLSTVSAATLKAQQPAIVQGVVDITKGKLAKDATIETKDLGKLLDVINVLEPQDVMDDDDDPLGGTMDAGGLSPEEEAQYQALSKKRGSMTGDAEETEEEKKAREAKAGAKDEGKDKEDDKPAFLKKKAEDEEKKDMVDKKAMDSAIAVAVKRATDEATKRQSAIRDAERAVRGHVGDLAMAHDSAEAVYETALISLGENAAEIKGLPLAALKAILSHVPLPGANASNRTTVVAMDAASAKDFATMYPDAARIRLSS